MNLWQMPSGQYVTAPLGKGHRPHIMAVYIGTIGDLATKLRERGREKVAKRLPGLPDEIWAEAEKLAEAQRRVLRRTVPAAAAVPISDWTDDEGPSGCGPG